MKLPLVTVLGPRRLTRWFRWLPGFNVYASEMWSLEDNLRWVEQAWRRGDLFLVVPCHGDIFQAELVRLVELAADGTALEVDTTPVTYRLLCRECKRSWEQKGIAAHLDHLEPVGPGLYYNWDATCQYCLEDEEMTADGHYY